MAKTLTKEIIKSSLFERLRKAVNNAAFIVTAARGGGGTPHMKVMGMVVVSLRGANFGFWSHSGCSGQNAIIFYGCTRKNIKIYI